MFRLSLIILLLGSWGILSGQNNPGTDSPHGPDLQIDCKKCHTTNTWQLDLNAITFSHDSTSFVLEGQHTRTDCRLCHTSLIFNEANTDCNSCHTDVHQETVGRDCARCHDAQSWLVGNISTIHELASFPLEGVHFGVDCIDCHSSATDLAFYPILPECATCHQQDYDNTTDPNHTEAGFSNNCAECHSLNSFDWSAENYDHDFFPLTLGHSHIECKACHENNVFESLPTDCFACHENDYNESQNPSHINSDFSISCTDCHTTNPDWKPAEFRDHDALYFPIYHGEHAGEWNDCTECHQNENDFNQFSCTHCHEHRKSSMDNEHDDVSGYLYLDLACYACHPNGSSDNIFNHDDSNFPLTGFHRMVDCQDCHSDGYLGTPTDCFACHEQDYRESTNPDHESLNLSVDCSQCHTTDPNWVPASFDNHNEFYPLNGAHAAIADDCASCHQGNYNDTPNDCYGCHQQDYENALNPPHISSGFSQDCASCHTETAWEPSTFDHDMQYFPIYSGTHADEWTNCNECHTQPDNLMSFSCISCHEHNQQDTDEEHAGVNGYIYESQACFACHPTGTADDVFDHNLTAFPLTGAHIQTNCISCHENGYAGTPTECVACHQSDFDATTNPDHNQLNISSDCASCHTTDPDWQPAQFELHDEFYPLIGAHNLIRNDCASCHNGDYNNTPNSCYGCHQQDYEQTVDPPHQNLQFSTDCTSCHSEDSWSPSTFDHDAQYFPVYSGNHMGEWDNCADCHTDNNNYQVFTCIDCHAHQQAEMDDEHEGVGGYVYESNACLACHPTGDADENFDHNLTAFPLTGAHTVTACLDCHENGFEGTPTDCFACHESDFNQTLNPNHQNLGIANECAQCHTTDPGWSPASFAVHDEYYPLNGAHAQIANDCASCHNGDYNNTPNTCFACHQTDYNNTTDPNHAASQFSTDCASCHTESAWEPSTFDHDGLYFPIYSGEHQGEWNQCTDCHTNTNNYSLFSCTNCHTNPETDEEHDEVGGYVYEDMSCLACHPNGSADDGFDHNSTGFPLTGAHTGALCLDCHENGYENTSSDCVSCHQEDFNGSVNPNHQQLGLSTQCESCHTTEPGWEPATFAVHDEYYALTGAHATISTDCAACHANGDYVNTPNECNGCHQEDYNQTINPDHQTLGISQDCGSCHTTDPGWSPASFAVHDEYYPLNGAHAQIANDCASCHNGDYNNTPNTCFACHQTDYNNTTDPNHAASQFSTDCASCHTESAWEPSTFDHDGLYFPIYSGEHQGEWNQCADCHTNTNNYSLFSCTNCHTNPETDEEHDEVGGYVYEDMSCLACHPNGSADDGFDHNSTGFPLTGAHAGALCLDCHENGYENTSSDCVSCHQEDFNGSVNPNHLQLGLSTQCESCHTTEPGWEPATFAVHDEYYALTGAHATISTDCAACHANGDYVNTPNECNGCHQEDYNQTINPDHQTLGISQDCGSCHTTDPGWSPASFAVHDEYYPLNGAHAQIANDCANCHNGDYNNTPNTCFACHQTDYNNTTDPNHAASQFSTDCASCHTESAWEPSTFDHDGLYFPIYSGEHQGEWNQCADCHTNTNNYSLFSCTNCHTNPETDEEHDEVGGYVYEDMSCLACHPNGSADDGFDHNSTGFPLTGAHTGTLCLDCHENGYTNTSSDCVSCHQEDFNGSVNPNHQQLGLSTLCESCHTTEPGWEPATFAVHDDYYPLTGAHAIIATDCIACHTDGDYVNTPSDCAGCHQTDYNQTNDPDHQELSLSLDCASCHTTDPGWEPATFAIHDDFYPLTGAHALIATDCNLCHSNGYSNTPNSCFGCHESDYNNTNDPDHQAAQFPTDCQSCHSDLAWEPSTFDHDNMYFPIYSGKHDEEWNQCSDCHTVANNYSIFDCLGCHTNPETDEDHDEVSGYSYDSPSCYACHPTGDD